ncbi:nucleoside 2-deoxyribosyltransferase [Streptomyces sp. NPDC057302]|uniref:nucleoside 2-deoxyribosyltransferase n=1 Tax=Streptomyces sp. NPDC057302 TaxID=3346094 RepID=UPI0036365EDB
MTTQILVHFGTERVSLHRRHSGELQLLTRKRLPFRAGLTGEALADSVSGFCAGLKEFTEVVDTKSTRVHATGVFQRLPQPEAATLVNSFFVDTGLYFNIVGPELERFYLDVAASAGGSDDMVEGLIRQELRTAVVCGSFQQCLGDIEGTIAQLRETGAEVLSPRSTRIKPETEGTDFILFDYQDELKNARDTWRHKYVHMEAFRRADAVVVCNPGGRVGSGTVFELGFLAALGKRVIFTQEPRGVSVSFPCEVGLGA